MDRLLRTSQTDRAAEDHPANRITLPEGAIIDVIAAERVGDYALKISFSDGAQRIVDFEPFLRRAANPQIRTYLEPARFSNFRIEDGDLFWDDYGLCFSVADLYESRL
jgi:uncharacterized protein DUF2442